MILLEYFDLAQLSFSYPKVSDFDFKREKDKNQNLNYKSDMQKQISVDNQSIYI